MPTPTTQISFGGTTSETGVYAIVELDEVNNVDDDGNVLTTFLDDERVYILVHHEPGAEVKNVNCSSGSIINKNNPTRVQRSKTIENVVFKSTEDGYQLQHFPNGGITTVWEGESGTIAIEDRNLTCNQWPRVANITYQYSAWLYILEVDSLGLEEDEEFQVDVSFEVGKI